jgi:hypothetical protein
MTEPPADPGRRRGPLAVALVAGGLVASAWAPSFVATAYAEDDATEYLSNPVRGWVFLGHAVTASRNPRLGTAGAAMEQAAQIWAGAPAVAADVSLRTLPSPWTVPVPDGGVRPGPGRAAASPAGPLNWVVTGRVAGGPSQVIGLLDYRTGRVEWDIRPVPGGRR